MPVIAQINDEGTHINIDAPIRLKELIRDIPGAYGNRKTNVWRVPLSWASCVQLKNTFKEDLEPSPQLAEWVQNEYRDRIYPAMMLREQLTLPEGEGDADLYDHQRAGVKFLATAERALLADEPGLGKSAQAIRALTELQRRGINQFPVLVICPNTLKTNWLREFDRWWPGLRVLIIDGTPVQRRKQFDRYLNPQEGDQKPHVIIINWEALRAHSRLAPYGSIALTKCVEHGGGDPKITAARCEVHNKELNEIRFEAIIADEIHRARNPASAQTRAFWAASGDAKGQSRFGLTGSPQSGDVTDLWGIMHWVSPEEWPSRSKWIDRTVSVRDRPWGGIDILGLKPEVYAEFFSILNPRMRRMIKKIVLPQLPPIVKQVRIIEMSAKQKKAYKQMEEKQMALVTGGVLLAKQKLTAAKRLQQFAMAYAELEDNGKVDDEGNPIMDVKLSEPSCTAEAIANDIIEGDFGPQSIAVMAVSSQMLELISARLTKANIPHGMITGDYSLDVRQNAIDNFQQGFTKVILYTAQAGGVGVTLTAASVLLRAEIPFSLIDYLQANDRVHRIGSEIHESILIVDYFVKDTVQYKTFEAIEKKGLNFEDVVRDQAQLAAFYAEEGVLPW